MAVIDAALLTAVQAGRRIEDLDSSPTVDIEIVREPYLDGAEYGQEFVDRVNRLREPFTDGSKPALLVIYGESVISGSTGSGSAVWEPVLQALRAHTGQRLLCVPRLGSSDSTELFKIPGDNGAGCAYLAVIGLQSGHGRNVTELVRRLAGGVASTAPLYVVGVFPGDLLAPEHEALLRVCQRVRMSVVIHANSGRNDLLTVSGAELLTAGRAESDVSLVGCPTSKAGQGYPGITRLRLDVWKGEAEVAFRHDLGSDREPNRPVQVVRPLASASRVRPSERRLYARVQELLAPHRADTEVKKFKEYVERCWRDWGYVAICDDKGQLPAALQPTRQLRYHLLLLLRQREDGRLEILLSHHTPQRPPPVAHWDSLLLPAFQDVRSLLERLREDVMRQAVEQPDDLEQRERARSFEAAVDHILASERPDDANLWGDQIRELATDTWRKISPTSGFVTEYEYRLVTLLPFVERDPAGGEYVAKVVHWLDHLQVISANGRRDRDTRGTSIEALRADGSGLRWEPSVELLDEPDCVARRKATRVPPGAVWFPFDRDAAVWRECPAIVARNADVMIWTAKQLELQRRAGGGMLPADLQLARSSTSTERFRVVGEPLPFAATVAALSEVQLGFLDLEGEPAYDASDVRRVFLVRRDRSWFPGAPERGGIFVFEADHYTRDAVRTLPLSRAVGMLRPVQRYVLKAGLARAAMVYEDVVNELVDHGDPWGWARISRGGASGDAALTPPILERLHPVDWDDARSTTDFLVCDGNHRIVYAVWNARQVMSAVAVWAPPMFPYYARPFGRLEWDATAENEQVVTPQLQSKYLPRRVTEAELRDPSIITRVPKDEWYRRYFRDLATGFGYMGGQGGRSV